MSNTPQPIPPVSWIDQGDPIQAMLLQMFLMGQGPFSQGYDPTMMPGQLSSIWGQLPQTDAEGDRLDPNQMGNLLQDVNSITMDQLSAAMAGSQAYAPGAFEPNVSYTMVDNDAIRLFNTYLADPTSFSGRIAEGLERGQSIDTTISQLRSSVNKALEAEGIESGNEYEITDPSLAPIILSLPPRTDETQQPVGVNWVMAREDAQDIARTYAERPIAGPTGVTYDEQGNIISQGGETFWTTDEMGRPVLMERKSEPSQASEWFTENGFSLPTDRYQPGDFLPAQWHELMANPTDYGAQIGAIEQQLRELRGVGNMHGGFAGGGNPLFEGEPWDTGVMGSPQAAGNAVVQRAQAGSVPTELGGLPTNTPEGNRIIEMGNIEVDPYADMFGGGPITNASDPRLAPGYEVPIGDVMSGGEVPSSNFIYNPMDYNTRPSEPGAGQLGNIEVDPNAEVQGGPGGAQTDQGYEENIDELVNEEVINGDYDYVGGMGGEGFVFRGRQTGLLYTLNELNAIQKFARTRQPRPTEEGGPIGPPAPGRDNPGPFPEDTSDPASYDEYLAQLTADIPQGPGQGAGVGEQAAQERYDQLQQLAAGGLGDLPGYVYGGGRYQTGLPQAGTEDWQAYLNYMTGGMMTGEVPPYSPTTPMDETAAQVAENAARNRPDLMDLGLAGLPGYVYGGSPQTNPPTPMDVTAAQVAQNANRNRPDLMPGGDVGLAGTPGYAYGGSTASNPQIAQYINNARLNPRQSGALTAFGLTPEEIAQILPGGTGETPRYTLPRWDTGEQPVQTQTSPPLSEQISREERRSIPSSGARNYNPERTRLYQRRAELIRQQSRQNRAMYGQDYGAALAQAMVMYNLGISPLQQEIAARQQPMVAQGMPRGTVPGWNQFYG